MHVIKRELLHPFFIRITLFRRDPLYVLYMDTSTRQRVNWLPSRFSVFVNNCGALRKRESLDSSPLLTLDLALSVTIFTQFTIPLSLTLFGHFFWFTRNFKMWNSVPVVKDLFCHFIEIPKTRKSTWYKRDALNNVFTAFWGSRYYTRIWKHNSSFLDIQRFSYMYRHTLAEKLCRKVSHAKNEF